MPRMNAKSDGLACAARTLTSALGTFAIGFGMGILSTKGRLLNPPSLIAFIILINKMRTCWIVFSSFTISLVFFVYSMISLCRTPSSLLSDNLFYVFFLAAASFVTLFTASFFCIVQCR